jgi:NAD(P)-dependent dehydrogenase (short-subunit alcohol dehydrogenase family)
MRTPQRPIPSGYGAQSTPRDVIGRREMTDSTVIVTGGYAGIGIETTRALSEAGATVIVAGRSPDRMQSATNGMKRVELEELDLFDPASIDAFAERFLASGRPLHVLVNNAGVMATPPSRDARGFESQLAINHLGHFQLTARLWPALKKANGARVVALSSRGHAMGAIDFDDPHFERRPYDKYLAYGQSKTANALFAVALDARGEPHRVRAFSVHPGTIFTELMRSIPEEEVRAGLARTPNLVVKTPGQGAATSVWCAVSAQLDGMGGVYCEDMDIAAVELSDSPAVPGVRPWATDPVLADRLWTMSETWTGVRFNL